MWPKFREQALIDDAVVDLAVLVEEYDNYDRFMQWPNWVMETFHPRLRADALGLTYTEARCVFLATCGLENKEIAQRIGISPYTVKGSLQTISDKAGLAKGKRNRTSLSLWYLFHSQIEIYKRISFHKATDPGFAHTQEETQKCYYETTETLRPYVFITGESPDEVWHYLFVRLRHRIIPATQ